MVIGIHRAPTKGNGATACIADGIDDAITKPIIRRTPIIGFARQSRLDNLIFFDAFAFEVLIKRVAPIWGKADFKFFL